MSAIGTIVTLAVGIWAGALAMYWRLGTRATFLTSWEDDLRDRQRELERLFDIVADERRSVNRARGKHSKGDK